MRKLKHKDGFKILSCVDCKDEYYFSLHQFGSIFDCPSFYICDDCAKKDREE